MNESVDFNFDFRKWKASVDEKLLESLKSFSEKIETEFFISPAPGSIGRHGGTSMSMHNVDRWGTVKAIDIMFSNLEFNAESVKKILNAAKKSNFGGVGVYPHWQPRWGVHLDIRKKKKNGKIAKWARNKKGIYVSIDDVIN